MSEPKITNESGLDFFRWIITNELLHDIFGLTSVLQLDLICATKGTEAWDEMLRFFSYLISL